MFPVEIKIPSKIEKNVLDDLIIFRSNGELFFHLPSGKRFMTLPKGSYFVSVKPELLKISKFEYSPVFHKKEKNLQRKHPIKWGINPNKASVYPDGSILMDNGLKAYGLAVILAIYLHELAHDYYFTEYKCDRWAAEKMRKYGWNKSQIDAAFKSTLYDEFRKSKITNRVNFM